MPEPQSFKNHARFDPPFHFFATPILLINLILTIVICVTGAIHHGSHHLAMHIWLIVLSFALVVVSTKSRVKDLKLQDRVIRLEERLRYATMLPPAEHAASSDLSIKQIVALPLFLGCRTAGSREKNRCRTSGAETDQTDYRHLATRRPPRVKQRRNCLTSASFSFPNGACVFSLSFSQRNTQLQPADYSDESLSQPSPLTYPELSLRISLATLPLDPRGETHDDSECLPQQVQSGKRRCPPGPAVAVRSARSRRLKIFEGLPHRSGRDPFRPRNLRGAGTSSQASHRARTLALVRTLAPVFALSSSVLSFPKGICFLLPRRYTPKC